MIKSASGKGAILRAESPKSTGTQSIQRAALLLRAIAANNRSGLRLVDLVRFSGLEQPTVHRMLKSLIAESMVMQNVENRRYFLGPVIFEFGLAAEQHFSLRELCQASLSRIAEKTGDTVFLTVRRANEAVCIDRKDGAFPVKVFTLNVGDRRPLGTGAGGLAILSALPIQQAQQIIDANADLLGSYGNLTPSALLGLVRQTKERGYALHNVFSVSGVKALGVAIKDKAGEPFSAISISAISARISDTRLVDLIALLKQEAALIEKLISRRVQIMQGY